MDVLQFCRDCPFCLKGVRGYHICNLLLIGSEKNQQYGGGKGDGRKREVEKEKESECMLQKVYRDESNEIHI